MEESGLDHNEMSAMTRMWEEKINPHDGTRPFHKKSLFVKRKFEDTTPNFSKPKMKESQGSSSKKMRTNASVTCFLYQQREYYANDYKNKEVAKKVTTILNIH